MSKHRVAVRLILPLAVLGVAETDADGTRARKAALTFAAALITVPAIIWVDSSGQITGVAHNDLS